MLMAAVVPGGPIKHAPGRAKVTPCRSARRTPPLGGRARGARQGRARRDAALRPRRLGAARRPARPGRAARGAGARPACPSWCRSATGACSPRRSRSTAARRRSWPPTWPTTPAHGPARCSSAATRTCPTSASSPRPSARLVFDLNDFDETLPGPVGVGRQAAGRQHRGRRPRPRLRREPSAATRRAGGRARLPRGDARVRRRCATSTSGTRASTSTTLVEPLGAERRRRARQARRAAASPRRARKDSLRALREAHRSASTASRASSADPPLIVPIERARCRRRGRDELEASIRDAARATTAQRSPPTGARLLDGYRYVAPGAQGRRRRQRRHARLDRAAARAATTATRCSCRSRRPGRRCSSRTPARARYAQPRPARRRGPAADAGGERHLPRLAAARPASTARERDFYVRQLWDWKGSADVETMAPRRRWRSTRELCGWTLARAHARSGDRVAIAAYLGARRRASTRRSPTFAEAYADQNERDYAALADAARSGRVVVERGL